MRASPSPKTSDDAVRLSIIIPVLNEADHLDEGLARLFSLSWVVDNCEVIICDGGSQDNSLEIARRYSCRIEHSAASRAIQMNQGAAVAQGRHLLFLHADSILPADLDRLFPGDARWGHFRLRLDNEAFVYRVIELAVNLRSRVTRVAGGDQGLYFARDFFQSLGAFPSIPLMEDVAICKLARREAGPEIIESPMHSSSRRWQNNGVLKTIVLMWSLRLAYCCGVDPVRLHRIYYPQRG
jgi:rSAM/selenodomain-associated transferase 2